MNAPDIIKTIQSGRVDQDLETIIFCAQQRRGAAGLSKTADDFHVGDRIRFNNRVNPQYMRGVTGVVRKVNRVRLVVDLDQPAGRFHHNIRTTVSIVDKVK